MLILASMFVVASLILAGILYVEDIYSARNSESYNLTVRLPYKRFIQFYWVNPERWRYTRVTKKDCCTLETRHKFLLYYSGNSNDVIRVNLSFPGNILFFFARLSRRFHSTSRGSETLLESVQKDIDRLREINQAQIKEATEQMESIKLRLKEQNKEAYECLKV